MTTPLLLLRAVQLGVQIGEMDLLTIGTINDMYTEMQNDENQGAYSTLASQEWIDFKGRRLTHGWTDPGHHR